MNLSPPSSTAGSEETSQSQSLSSSVDNSLRRNKRKSSRQRKHTSRESVSEDSLTLDVKTLAEWSHSDDTRYKSHLFYLQLTELLREVQFDYTVLDQHVQSWLVQLTHCWETLSSHEVRVFSIYIFRCVYGPLVLHSHPLTYSHTHTHTLNTLNTLTHTHTH
jgi:hypothetical protein